MNGRMKITWWQAFLILVAIENIVFAIIDKSLSDFIIAGLLMSIFFYDRACNGYQAALDIALPALREYEER